MIALVVIAVLLLAAAPRPGAAWAQQPVTRACFHPGVGNTRENASLLVPNVFLRQPMVTFGDAGAKRGRKHWFCSTARMPAAYGPTAVVDACKLTVRHSNPHRYRHVQHHPRHHPRR